MFLDAAITNEFYKDGFFGYGEKGDFKMFSLSYFIPIILMIVLVVLLYKYRNFFKNWKYEKNFRFIMGAIILFVEMSYFWRLLYVGSGSTTTNNLLTKLPLQICEWTCIFSAFLIMGEFKFLFDIDVFVCFTCGLIPFFVPTVIPTTGPTYYRYYQFYLEHMLPPLVVFYMMFVKGYKIDIKRVYYPLAFLLLLTIPSTLCNIYIDNSNYMYVGYRTSGLSISKVFHVNMFVAYLIFYAFIMCAFSLDYGVFKLIEHLKNKRLQGKEVPLVE